MKIFFVGDFIKDTGPGMANKTMRKGLGQDKNIVYSDANTKVLRVMELLIKIVNSDCVCFCSASKLNYVGVKLAKLLRKKIYYIMHGYIKYENRVNNLNYNSKIRLRGYEEYIFKNADRIFCVSEKFMNFMKEAEPNYAHKFDYNYNGLDIKSLENKFNTSSVNKEKNEKLVVSIGGGRRIKNNLMVCKAIDKLNREKDLNLRYIVIGQPYTDKEAICEYNFVTYYDKLPHDKVLKILANSNIYVQNSIFETFGLGVIEALFSRCNILISEKVGVTGIFKNLGICDIIYNTMNIDEISSKIENLLEQGNSKRLMEELEIQKVEYINTAKILLQKIKNYEGVK